VRVGTVVKSLLDEDQGSAIVVQWYTKKDAETHLRTIGALDEDATLSDETWEEIVERVDKYGPDFWDDVVETFRTLADNRP